MANTKISAMTNASTLDGTELVPLVQSGANVKVTVADLNAYAHAYGAFSDATDQTGSITVGTAMTFDTVDIADGVTLASGSRLTVPTDGIFDLQFSAQFKNTDNAQHIVTVWFKINGVDVPNSATQVTVPARKSVGVNGFAVAAWNIFLDMNAGQYVEIFWLTESLTVNLEHLPASVTPAYPAIPSVIATVQQVA